MTTTHETHQSRSSFGSLQQWAVTAVLIAAAFAIGARWQAPENAATQGNPDEPVNKETVIVQQINPPAIAIEATRDKGGARCIAVVGAADGRYWLVGEDGLAICVHDGRNDLYWWDENLTEETLLRR